MVTNAAALVGTRAGAFGMKYSKTALQWIKRNWQELSINGGILGGGAVIGTLHSDSDLENDINGMFAEDLSADEKSYAVQVLKDTADDLKSGDIFVPFSKRENAYITPTHLVIDLHTGRQWMTNNYISPNYVKALRRNTVSRRSTYRRKR